MDTTSLTNATNGIAAINPEAQEALAELKAVFGN